MVKDIKKIQKAINVISVMLQMEKEFPKLLTV